MWRLCRVTQNKNNKYGLIQERTMRYFTQNKSRLEKSYWESVILMSQVLESFKEFLFKLVVEADVFSKVYQLVNRWVCKEGCVSPVVRGWTSLRQTQQDGSFILCNLYGGRVLHHDRRHDASVLQNTTRYQDKADTTSLLRS